jgi:hypothetical protein
MRLRNLHAAVSDVDGALIRWNACDQETALANWNSNPKELGMGKWRVFGFGLAFVSCLLVALEVWLDS